MNLRVDALPQQMCLQGIALQAAYHEQMPDVLLLGHRRGQHDQRVADTVQISPCHCTPQRDLVLQIAQLDAQESSLHFIQTRVHPLAEMVILHFRAVVTQRANALGQTRIRRRDCAAIAQCAQILGREETEGRRIAEGTGTLPPCACPVRLRGILDQQQAVAMGQGLQGLHLGQLPIQVHCHDGACAWPDRLFHPCRVDVESDRVRLDRHQHQMVLADRQKCRDEGVGRHDDFVAFAQHPQLTVAAQDQPQRIQPVAHADCMRGAAITGEFFFECGQLLTEHIPAGIDHTCRCGFELIRIACIDCTQIQERHIHYINHR